MMIPRACDFCQRPLPSEVVQFEVARGGIVKMPRQQWYVEPRPGGQEMHLICRPCSDFLMAALKHLSQQLAAAGGWDGVRAGVAARPRARAAAGRSARAA